MRHCRGRGSIPHQGPKIPHGARPGQTNNNNKNQPNSHAISLPLLFLSKETKPFLCFPWQQNSSKGTSMLPVYKSPPLFLLSNQIMKIFSPTTPMSSHGRVLSLLVAMLLSCCGLAVVCCVTGYTHGMHTLAFMAAEVRYGHRPLLWLCSRVFPRKLEGG